MTTKVIDTKPTFFSRFPIILVLLVGILSYSNTFHGPFIFDDAQNIVKLDEVHLDNFSSNELSKLGQAIADKGRPVAMISLALNYYFGGLDTFGYHLVNLLTHLLTAILVYLLLNLTLNLPSLKERYGPQAREIALASSLLFVVHPIQTQAVSYIVQRMASMAALFFLLAIYCYAKARITEAKLRTSYFIGAALAALLALGSKENSITLPFFILLYEYYFHKQFKLGKARKKWLYTIIALSLLGILLAGIYTKFDITNILNEGYKNRTFTPGQRMLTQLRVVIFYLSLLIAPLPSRLSLDHYFPVSYSLINPPTTLLCLGLVLSLVIGSIYLAKKRPLISFAMIWFWANLVLESSFLPLELVFEHRLYLPSVGFFLLVSIFLVKSIDGLKSHPQKRLIKAGLLPALVVLLMSFTYQRNEVWQSELVLWEDAVSKSPTARTYYNLGSIYLKQGQLVKAIAQFQRALENNPKLKPALNNLGIAYADHGQPTKAIAQFQYLLEIAPTHKEARKNLTHLYRQQDELKQTIAENLAVIKLHPDNANAYYNLGNAYWEQGQWPKAITQFLRTLEIDPRHENTHNNLGRIYFQQDKLEQARIEFLQELKLYPNNAKAHKRIGFVYITTQNHTKALAHFEKSLALDPQQSEVDRIIKTIKSLKLVLKI